MKNWDLDKILALVESGEPEGLSYEYKSVEKLKQKFSGTDAAQKEKNKRDICEAISAFATSNRL